MLHRGDLIPHFTVTTLEGDTIAYSTIWQHKNLVLVALPASDADGSFRHYVSQLTSQMHAFTAADSACVITQDDVAGVPCPGVVVADRWGEVVHVASGPEAAALPLPGEVLDWVDYVQRQCPECQGEAK